MDIHEAKRGRGREENKVSGDPCSFKSKDIVLTSEGVTIGGKASSLVRTLPVFHATKVSLSFHRLFARAPRSETDFESCS